jgi:VIT1/CCC1 family predicted Fe2+/Mn2+ transporter
VSSTFAEFGIPQSAIDEITLHLRKSSPEVFTTFLLRFQHTLSAPPQSRASICAFTIAAAYFFGGLVPLLPYFFVARIDIALISSIVMMIVALFVFGYAKACFVSGWSGGRNI